MAGRRNIYYWKSDRAFASENTRSTANPSSTAIAAQLSDYLNRFFREGLVHVEPAHGQGNHITFKAHYPESDYFIRLENGPEGDNHMAIESHVMSMVKEQGIPCPTIHLTDVSRTEVPFAIQVMELIHAPDLNQHSPKGDSDALLIAQDIGRYIAQWQAIRPENFGLFDLEDFLATGQLRGYHTHYADYFQLNLDKHLDFLVGNNFLSRAQQQQILDLVREHEMLLSLSRGCLVHKDLAFWNILSDGRKICAFIDWDDAISGDPVDDLSLLACFHTGALVSAAIRGYVQVRPLPDHFEKRFWLHLLRNMIFKAVIRVRGN
ncbi:aminoglycoside phosphotransferase family protein [Parapedobacter defluvii]|uniref:phosphotransferase family protein n=1 Tax=Parapedobacter defluvii TaxID=2045106 RepID=UPI00333F55AB